MDGASGLHAVGCLALFLFYHSSRLNQKKTKELKKHGGFDWRTVRHDSIPVAFKCCRNGSRILRLKQPERNLGGHPPFYPSPGQGRKPQRKLNQTQSVTQAAEKRQANSQARRLMKECSSRPCKRDMNNYASRCLAPSSSGLGLPVAS
ncbi:hypothetical protein B0T21DRAFT_179235 [Apiosordaria backusii]|uniref:Uncharacterized protein n=1 Tax=Apiosordaria backusii TaxID=314023 RepID=A0AA40BLL2_9PEZI|nr:hypothetical protein B0T21DRAFT_179235 [Apiosordaria backusii]